MAKKGRKLKTIDEFLSQHVVKQIDGCWISSAESLTRTLQQEYKISTVKRFLYFKHKGTLSKMLHPLCTTDKCVNPEHFTEETPPDWGCWYKPCKSTKGFKRKYVSANEFWCLDSADLLNWAVDGEYPVYEDYEGEKYCIGIR